MGRPGAASLASRRDHRRQGIELVLQIGSSPLHQTVAVGDEDGSWHQLVVVLDDVFPGDADAQTRCVGDVQQPGRALVPDEDRRRVTGAGIGQRAGARLILALPERCDGLGVQPGAQEVETTDDRCRTVHNDGVGAGRGSQLLHPGDRTDTVPRTSSATLSSHWCPRLCRRRGAWLTRCRSPPRGRAPSSPSRPGGRRLTSRRAWGRRTCRRYSRLRRGACRRARDPPAGSAGVLTLPGEAPHWRCLTGLRSTA